MKPRIRTTALGITALLACPAWAHADAGVPMLALMAVPIWASLLVIIPLEAFLAKRRVGTDWGTSLKMSAIANLVSTVVGVPVTWVLLVLVQLPLQGLAASLYGERVPPRVGPAIAAAGAKALGVV